VSNHLFLFKKFFEKREKSVDNIILLWYYTYREKHISDGQRAVGNIGATTNALLF